MTESASSDPADRGRRPAQTESWPPACGAGEFREKGFTRRGGMRG